MKISKVVDGINILRKYYKDQDGYMDASHDRIELAPDESISPADIAELEKLGWSYSDALDSWVAYV